MYLKIIDLLSLICQDAVFSTEQVIEQIQLEKVKILIKSHFFVQLGSVHLFQQFFSVMLD